MEDMFWILPQLVWKNCVSADMMKTSYLLGLLYIHRRQMSTSEPSVYSPSCTSQPPPPARYKTLRFVTSLLYLCVFFVVHTRDNIKWPGLCDGEAWCSLWGKKIKLKFKCSQMNLGCRRGNMAVVRVTLLEMTDKNIARPKQRWTEQTRNRLILFRRCWC